MPYQPPASLAQGAGSWARGSGWASRRRTPPSVGSHLRKDIPVISWRYRRVFDLLLPVISHDETTPKLELHGLPDPRVIFENLKQRVIAVKRQRGVIKMDVG